MAVTATPYASFANGLGTGSFNLPSDVLNVMLVANTYTPDVNTHTNKAHVTGEITGTGYTAGGALLANKTWTYDTTNKRMVLGADPVTWTGATFTARYAVVYRTSDQALIGYINFGIDKTYTSEDFQLSFPSGVVRLRMV